MSTTKWLGVISSILATVVAFEVFIITHIQQL